MALPYPGTDSLPQEVKDRVLSTFRQTLSTYRSGNVADAIAGCDLLLKMDPLFDPAKKLLAKANNPFADIDVDSLIPTEELEAEQLAEARRALEERDFHRASAICTTLLAADLTNDQAQQIAAQAQERLEAEPFIEQFLEKARSEMRAGNLQAARASVDKARALDPTHPGIAKEQSAIDSAAAPPAFVVENRQGSQPEPAGRNRVEPAHDFGFTFEEDRASDSSFSFEGTGGGGGSFGSLDHAPAETGEAHTFDFATASVELTPEDEAKVQQYLSEGDNASAEGDYQKAIDLWSRVFLIDVTNEEASSRIESAKRRKLDTDQQLEDLLIAAELSMDSRDYTSAREKFGQALELDPGNLAARDGLARIDAAPKPSENKAWASQPTAPPLEMFDDLALSSASAPAPAQDAFRASAPAARPAVAPAAPKAAAGPRFSLKLPGINPMILIALLGVAVLGVGGFFAYLKFSSSRAQKAAEQSQATLSEAQALAKRGKLDEAISLLVGIQPDDPEHDRALEMIADLKKRKAESSGLVGGRPATVVFQELVAKGREAYAAHDFSAAKQAFEQASAIRPLPPDVRPMLNEANQQVSKLETANNLFKEGRYSEALGYLDPLHQADPANRNVIQLIANAHFNLAVTALREERDTDAIREFDAALQLDPNDEIAKRSRDIAVRYQGNPKDLLYKIYVKYVTLR